MKITIGDSKEGKIGFDLDTLITTRLLIQANSGAGKSYLLRVLMEQLFGHVQVIAIDPEGEFATLREKFGFVLIGKGGETPADTRSAAIVAERLLELRASAIVDLYEMKPSERHRYVETFLNALVNAPKKLWHPAIVIVDEAHLFCPEKGAGESLASESMIDLATRGRKRGFCAVWATQRLSKLRKDASAELLNRLIGGTFEDLDTKRALDALSVPSEEKREFAANLKTLEPGSFYAFGRAIARERTLFKVRSAETSHPKPGSAKHAAEAPPTPEKIKELLPKLADLPAAAEERAKTVEDLRSQIRNLKLELGTLKTSRPPAPIAIDQEKVRKSIEASVRSALKERDSHWMRTFRDYRRGIEKTLATAFHQADAAVRSIETVLPADIGEISADVQVQAIAKSVPPPANPKEGNRQTEHRERSREARPSDTVSGPQAKILEALAMFESLGRKPIDKKWIAAYAGASYSSSTYTNNLGALRSAGYIEYPGPGRAQLTQDGRAIAPPIEYPSTPEQVLKRCREIVSGPQAAILDVLFGIYPKSIDKAELAELVQASATSSTYTNNLGALRSAGMIEYPEKGKAKLSSWIQLEDEY